MGLDTRHLPLDNRPVAVTGGDNDFDAQYYHQDSSYKDIIVVLAFIMCQLIQEQPLSGTGYKKIFITIQTCHKHWKILESSTIHILELRKLKANAYRSVMEQSKRRT